MTSRNLNKRAIFALVLTLTAALVLGACGSDNASDSTATTAATGPVDCASGSATGAGSTFVQTLAQQWIKDFGNACPDATINYQGVGSGAGVQQFLSGTVDFAGSDAVLKAEEEQAAVAKGGAVIHVPWAAGGIAVLYNLDGVEDLKLSPDAVAGIFAGTIKKWDDAKIKADNGGVDLPSSNIQVVHRSDGSGTTKVFTSYMTATAPGVWTVGADKDVAWPTGQGAKGSDGVTAAIKQAQGSIGYAEVSFAQAAGLRVAKIKNPSGQFVAPTAEAVSAALGAAETPDDLKVKVSYTPDDAKAYPISTTTWVIAYVKPADAAKGKLLKAFFLYALGNGQNAAPELGYAPIPAELATKAKAAVEKMG